MNSGISLLIGLCVIYVSYSVYQVPVPPDIKYPSRLRTSLVLNDLYRHGFHILDSLGIVKDYEAHRWLGEFRAVRRVEGVDMEDRVIDGVLVRVYTPVGVSTGGKGMVYYHGGGWVLGSISAYNSLAGYFALQGEMTVVSVNYRLVPEHSKDDGLEDCLMATKYVIQHGEEFSINPEKIVVAGDSAGGNYAAAVSLRLRDEFFSQMPRLQLLMVPVLQMVDLQLPSYQQHKHGPHLTAARMHWFFSHVLGMDTSEKWKLEQSDHVSLDVKITMMHSLLNHDFLPDRNKYPPYRRPNYKTGNSANSWNAISKHVLDPYGYPLMCKDLTNLPEAYIFTAQYDVLRDDGFLYAYHLQKAGNTVHHYNSPHGWHSMALYLYMDDIRQEFDDMMEFVKLKLA